MHVKKLYSFSPTVIKKAFFRQMFLCAHCGDNLLDLSENAHHVIPKQTGKPTDPLDVFLRTESNCVILCEPCHTRVHQDGRYKMGAVAGPEGYPYSHGTDRLEHRKWVKQIDFEWGRKFP